MLLVCSLQGSRHSISSRHRIAKTVQLISVALRPLVWQKRLKAEAGF